MAAKTFWLLAVASCVGGAGALAFLTLPGDGVPEPTTPAIDAAPASTARRAIAPPAAPVERGTPSAMASLDDATLVQRAHDEFGLDCPEIENRSAVVDTGFDVHCTNGTRLRVSMRAGVLAITTAD